MNVVFFGKKTLKNDERANLCKFLSRQNDHQFSFFKQNQYKLVIDKMNANI